MANSKSAEKRPRTNERRRISNRRFRSAGRTLVRTAEQTIAGAEQEAAAGAVTNAISMLDRAARKGIIHPNNAARRKSRLMAKFNKLNAAS